RKKSPSPRTRVASSKEPSMQSEDRACRPVPVSSRLPKRRRSAHPRGDETKESGHPPLERQIARAASHPTADGESVAAPNGREHLHPKLRGPRHRAGCPHCYSPQVVPAPRGFAGRKCKG